MIIIFILLGLVLWFVVSIIIYFIHNYKAKYLWQEWDNMHLIVNAGFGGIFMLTDILLMLICIVNNSRYEIRKVQIWYNNSVENFNSSKQFILTIADDYSRSIAIQQYNNDVKDFKIKLQDRQNELNNHWINWFTCCEYKNCDSSKVSYIVSL